MHVGELTARSAEVAPARVRALPDTYPVDEHLRRVGARAGITAAGAGNREIEDRVNGVAGPIERPVRQRIRRSRRKYGCAPSTWSFQKRIPGRVPLTTATCANRCQSDVVGLPFAAVCFGVDGGRRWPAAIAVPLDDVDLAPWSSLPSQCAGQLPGSGNRT